jgi:hypothetical protein
MQYQWAALGSPDLSACGGLFRDKNCKILGCLLLIWKFSMPPQSRACGSDVCY